MYFMTKKTSHEEVAEAFSTTAGFKMKQWHAGAYDFMIIHQSSFREAPRTQPGFGF